MQTLPEYTDGCFTLYDIVDIDTEYSKERRIRAREIEPIWYRGEAVFDRTRVVFEQAGKSIDMKIRIPRWNGISSDCVCIISGVQYKVYNKADVLSKQGYLETELTLVTPEIYYEVDE